MKTKKKAKRELKKEKKNKTVQGKNPEKKSRVIKKSGKRKEPARPKRKHGRALPKERRIIGQVVKKEKKKEKRIAGKKRQVKKKVSPLQEKAVLQESALLIKEKAKMPPPAKEKPKEKAEPAVEKKRDIIIDEKEAKRLLEKYKHNGIFEKKERKIEIKDMGYLLKKLKDETAVYVLECLRKKNQVLAEKLFLGKTFESEIELEKYLKEETVKMLVSETDSLKGRVSELRKKGGDVNYLDFRVMRIPLKIKVFSASFDKKDFDAVVQILDKAIKEVKEAEMAFSERKSED